MAVIVLNKNRVGVGGPGKKSKFAYAYLADDISYFPPVDATEVNLIGDMVLKPGAVVIKLYVTITSQEYSYESVGEKDNRAFKVKFIGTHPGTEIEALEFAKKNQDLDFIIIIPEGMNTNKSKLLGNPNSPLSFRSSHKSGKDGSKFEFTFEQEVPSEDVYLHYSGALNTEGGILNWNPEIGNLPPEGVYYVSSGSDLMFTDGSVSDFYTPGKKITLIGSDSAMGGYMTLVTGTKIILRENKPWKSIKGSRIVLESFVSSDSQTKLIEVLRT